MPSSRRQASNNPTLTNYAVGLAQMFVNSIANFMCPIVEVVSTVGQFKRYDSAQAFRIYNTARATGGKFNRIEFESDDPFYNCKPQGLEVTVDDDELDAAGDEGDAQSRLAQNKIKTLLSNCAGSHEYDVLGRVRAATTAVAELGKWRDPNVDPIAEINAVIETIATDIGQFPTRSVVGLPLLTILCNHPKVLARRPGADVNTVTLDHIAQMTINPAMKIRAGLLSSVGSKPGGSATRANITGSSMYVFFAEDNPNEYDASWFKNFTGRRGGVTKVETYREEGSTSDVHRVRWSRDVQLTASLSGKRIDLRAS